MHHAGAGGGTYARAMLRQPETTRPLPTPRERSRPNSSRGVVLVRAAAWARSRSGRWWLCAFLLAVGLAQAAQLTLAFFGDRRLIFYGYDFPAFYAAAHMVAHGSSELLYDAEAVGRTELELVGRPVGGTGVLAYFNPPFFALLLTPLSLFTMERAFQLWTLFNLVLLGVAVLMMRALTDDLSRKTRWMLILGFVTLVPVTYGLAHGQFSLILLTSWSAAFLLMRRGRDAAAGIALSPLLIKPELLIVVAIYVIFKRRWRVLATLAPITAGAVIVSVWTVGVTAAVDYPSYLMESTRWDDRGVTSRLMFDWNGIVAMVWDAPASHARLALIAGLSLATVVLAVRSWHAGTDRLPGRFELHWLILTVATILVDPHFYLQDTILLALPAFAFLNAVDARAHRPLLFVMMAGWALLALGTFPNQYLHINLVGLYLLGCFAFLLSWNPIAPLAGRFTFARASP
jgi:hypothetical protein